MQASVGRSFLQLIAPDCAANPIVPPKNCTKLREKSVLGKDKFAPENLIRASLCRGMPVTFNGCGLMMMPAVIISEFSERPLTQENRSIVENKLLDKMNKFNIRNGDNCPTVGGVRATDTKHVMTIVGSRAGAGNQTEYLVQNSWGRRCDLPRIGDDLQERFAGLECEVDQAGPTGRIWVQKSIFESMSYSLGIIE
jgi:hypothetical protein